VVIEREAAAEADLAAQTRRAHRLAPVRHGRLGAREGGDLHRQQRHEPHAVPLDDPVGTALRAVRRLRAVRLSPAVLALLYSPVPARGTEPKWRNWQTRRTQNPLIRKDRAGSTPAFGTTPRTRVRLRRPPLRMRPSPTAAAAR